MDAAILPRFARAFCLCAAMAVVVPGQTCADDLLPGTYRTIDGIGNNSTNGSWGAVGENLLRIGSANYEGDGSGSTMSMAPGARTVSNTVAAQGSMTADQRGMSDFVWQWGQFVDHDISLTHTGSQYGTATLTLPVGDILGSLVDFDRSEYDPATGTSSVNPRQQVNSITAYIDASNVYGSDAATAAALRDPSGGGRLLMRDVGGESFLPTSPTTGLVMAGDERAAEQIGLTAMHTLFAREHNRLAGILAANNASLTDEQIYQKARKIVGGQMQVITYHEFLPALLGDVAPTAADFQYDSGIDPGIANEFSTALYRVGHTMLSPSFSLQDENGVETSSIALRDAFFNPSLLESPEVIESLFRGLAHSPAQQIDNLLVDDVRNFLFGPPGAGGLDLAMLNIQRGRDHGLPDYNSMRQAYGFARVTRFDQITSDADLQAALLAIYGDVDSIDPWVGALAEDHLRGASVGELIAVGMVDQFTRLRDGDRFFYLNDPDFTSDADILAAVGDISGTTLSAIIARNTGVTHMGNVFSVVPEPSGILLAALGGLIGLWMVRKKKALTRR